MKQRGIPSTGELDFQGPPEDLYYGQVSREGIGIMRFGAILARLARGHDDRQLHRQPAPEAWSARDVVAHLRACAEVWGRSIDRMIQEDHPTIRYVSPRGWIKKTDYLEHGFGASLRAFSEARAALLDTLRALNPTGWSRRATFTGTTLGRDATVLIYARRIADHAVRHLDQLRRILTP